MFIDYLTLTFLLPHTNPESAPGWRYADELARRAKVAGELHLDGSTFQKFHVYPEGLRCIMEWGGSALPLDLNDFVRRFRRYEHWTVSRIDLAENVDNLTRDDIRLGSSHVANDWWECGHIGEEEARIWTGCGLGKRGGCGSYFRCYDARKHADGRSAKLARFGRCDFWRVEYELGREFLRREGIDTFAQVTPELLIQLWCNETNKKGFFIAGTSEYAPVRARDLADVEDEIAQERRLLQATRCAERLELMNLVALGLEVQRLITQAQEAGDYLYNPPSKKPRLTTPPEPEQDTDSFKARIDSVPWPEAHKQRARKAKP